MQSLNIINFGIFGGQIVVTKKCNNTKNFTYCGVGCQFKAEVRGDELVRMTPYKHGKANRGHSCVKGRFAYGYASHRDRI